MSKLIPGNQKHLTLKDREYIEQALNDGLAFKEIAKYICKDPTTVSKEVRLHRSMDTWNTRTFNNPYNFCIHRFSCKRTNVCDKLFICDNRCASCHKCNQMCRHFEKEQCSRLDKAPYVCNGCPKSKARCTVPHKYDYNARFAQRKYEELLVSSREGLNLTKKEAHALDAVVSPLVAQGQSPYQIVTNHPELEISVKTLYNYIDSGVLLTRNIDLKRKPKFKPRKHKKKRAKDMSVFIGRTYADFQTLAPEAFFEMDTVLSAKGSLKCILTLYIPDIELLVARLMNRCTIGAVKAEIDKIEAAMGSYEFISVFEVCLTDRGSEFEQPDKLETGIHGIQRTSVYYCDPMRSNQKAGIENVHTMLRMIIPKGTVFTNLTQWNVKTAVNHINSTPRANLNGYTPYQLALERYGPDILCALQLKYVEPDSVVLSPKLLKK